MSNKPSQLSIPPRFPGYSQLRGCPLTETMCLNTLADEARALQLGRCAAAITSGFNVWLVGVLVSCFAPQTATLNRPTSCRPLLHPIAEGDRQHLSAHHRSSVVARLFRQRLDDPAARAKPNRSSDGCHSFCRPAEPVQSKFFTRCGPTLHCFFKTTR